MSTKNKYDGKVMEDFQILQSTKDSRIKISFEATVRIVNLTTPIRGHHHEVTISTDEGGGVVSLSNAKSSVFGNWTVLPGVSFAFKVHDTNILRQHINSKPDRMKIWRENMVKEADSLKNESITYRDIVFVPTVDVYRNLPAKLLGFYQWMIRQEEFNFALKTDDDCFLDVDAIIDKLQTLTTKSSIWWGRFRYYWSLDTVGKWRETKYQAISYPPFACGSGYVISRDIAEWLANNAKYLSHYQGEDVSMGIWLASIFPNIIDDDSWQCKKLCNPGSLSLPELSLEDLNKTWLNKIACGNPCGCG